jgi:predicted RNA methylase
MSVHGRVRELEGILDSMARALQHGRPSPDFLSQWSRLYAELIELKTNKSQDYMKAMYSDDQRNRFFQRAIQGAVNGKTVLELGCGAGLLSVLSCFAGARQVYACESNPRMRELAHEVFRANGVEDRIHLIDKSSFALVDEIPRCDVIIHELFANDPFGEDALAVLLDARRFALADTVFIPGQLKLMAQIVRTDMLKSAWEPFHDVLGVDLRSLNQLSRPKRMYVHRDSQKMTSLQGPQVVGEVDFASFHEVSQTFAMKLPSTAPKENDFLVLYFELVAGRERLTSFTDDPFSHWKGMAYPLFTFSGAQELKIEILRNEISLCVF